MSNMAVSIEQTSGLPVAPPGGGEWTVDLLDQLPDDNLKYEILDGILLVSPSPIPRHQRAVVQLCYIFVGACPTDHEVFVAPLDWQPDKRTSLEPDLLVVAKDRVGEKNVTQNPAIVVEVLSPSSRRYDRVLKFGRYAEAGIPQYWIVDPDRPSIEVYDLDDQGAYILTASADGDQPCRVAGVLNVTITPSALISV